MTLPIRSKVRNRNIKYLKNMNKVNTVRKIKFNQFVDDRGALVAIEGGQTIPFEIKRILYLREMQINAKSELQHPNKNSDCVFVVLRGACTVKIEDVYGEAQTYLLDKQNEGLYVPSMLRKEVCDFKKGTVLMVISNEFASGE